MDDRSRKQRLLVIALFFTGSFMILEVAGSFLFRSLTLLADAGHMLTDFAALGMAYLAVWIAGKPPQGRMSYGFHRAEILAALLNGILLFDLVIYLIWKGVKRLSHPEAVIWKGVLVLALLGLFVNGLSAFFLKKMKDQDLNIRGAYFHVLADALSSVGVLVAALLIGGTGWMAIDSGVSILIGCIVIVSVWKLLKDSCEVLLEASPGHINLRELESSLLAIGGVRQVHDLHVWTIASGRDALSAHLDIEEKIDQDRLLKEISHLLENRFLIRHSTVQLEKVPHEGHGRHF